MLIDFGHKEMNGKEKGFILQIINLVKYKIKPAEKWQALGEKKLGIVSICLKSL